MGKQKKLIEIIFKQLKDSGNFEKIDIRSFSDGSGMWIDCYHTLSANNKGKRWAKHLSFNEDGSILEDVQVWQEQQAWDDDQQKELR